MLGDDLLLIHLHRPPFEFNESLASYQRSSKDDNVKVKAQLINGIELKPKK